MSIENPLESIATSLATSSQDQAQDRCDAWIYGIAVGWGDALPEVAAKHGWSPKEVARLRRLHLRYVALRDNFSSPLQSRTEVAFRCGVEVVVAVACNGEMRVVAVTRDPELMAAFPRGDTLVWMLTSTEEVCVRALVPTLVEAVVPNAFVPRDVAVMLGIKSALMTSAVLVPSLFDVAYVVARTVGSRAAQLHRGQDGRLDGRGSFKTLFRCVPAHAVVLDALPEALRELVIDAGYDAYVTGLGR